MVTLAPSSTPRVGDSAIEKIEVKLTHLKKKKTLQSWRWQIAWCLRVTADQLLCYWVTSDGVMMDGDVTRTWSGNFIDKTRPVNADFVPDSNLSGRSLLLPSCFAHLQFAAKISNFFVKVKWRNRLKALEKFYKFAFGFIVIWANVWLLISDELVSTASDIWWQF